MRRLAVEGHASEAIVQSGSKYVEGKCASTVGTELDARLRHVADGSRSRPSFLSERLCYGTLAQLDCEVGTTINDAMEQARALLEAALKEGNFIYATGNGELLGFLPFKKLDAELDGKPIFELPFALVKELGKGIGTAMFLESVERIHAQAGEGSEGGKSGAKILIRTSDSRVILSFVLPRSMDRSGEDRGISTHTQNFPGVDLHSKTGIVIDTSKFLEAFAYRYTH